MLGIKGKINTSICHAIVIEDEAKEQRCQWHINLWKKRRDVINGENN